MKEITLLYLNGKYPAKSFIKQYVFYRKKPIHNLNNIYLIQGHRVRLIDLIMDNYINFIIQWCINKFNITEVKNIKNNKIIKYV